MVATQLTQLQLFISNSRSMYHHKLVCHNTKSLSTDEKMFASVTFLTNICKQFCYKKLWWVSLSVCCNCCYWFYMHFLTGLTILGFLECLRIWIFKFPKPHSIKIAGAGMMSLLFPIIPWSWRDGREVVYVVTAHSAGTRADEKLCMQSCV